MGSPPFPPYGQYYAYPPPPPPEKHMVGTLPSVMAAHQQYGLPPPPPPPSRRPWVPWLMPLFFVGNVGVFVYAMYLNNCPSRHEEDCVADFLGRFSFEPFSVNAWLGPAPETLVKLGALQQDLVVKSKEYWRLFSCIWLHGGVIHLFANMLSLLFVGIRLEQDFGFLRIGILYLISGATASLTSCMWHSRISLGASGALFGLLGSMLSELFTNWTIYENKCMALLILIVVIVINLAIGFLPQVDNAAHIGGFIAGYLLGFVLLIRPQYGYVSRRRVPPGYDIGPPKSKYKAYQYLFLVMAISFLAVGYYFGLTKFLHMISENKQTDGHKEL